MQNIDLIIILVGLAASGFDDGLVWGNFEWMTSFTLILLGLYAGLLILTVGVLYTLLA